MKTVPRALLTLLFLIVLGSHSSLLSQDLHPRISYKIRVGASDLSGFDVEMRIQRAGDTVRIAMASHPEYDDRYWRYVENLRAESRGVRLQITNEENALWRVVSPGGDLTVKYRIHLPPQTTPIRAAWKPFLSATNGLIGDLHSFMYVVGETSVPTRVTLDLPSGWASASGLDPTKDPKTFTASSVELLLDSPIAVGKFRTWDFKVKGVPHTIVYSPQPNATSFDTVSFVAGIQLLAKEAIKIFGQPPYHRYTFLYQDGAYGALEHLNSVNIGATSQSLAQELKDVFGTTAHEYFHTWNLMHVRPVERVGVRFRPAQPTGELWWSEGVTIYFSDLLLRRAQLPVNPTFKRTQRAQPFVQPGSINEPDPKDRKEHDQRGSKQGHFRADFVGPFGGHLEDGEAGVFEGIEQVDIEGHVRNAEGGMDFFNRLAAHDLGSALGILNVHPKKQSHYQMERAAGELTAAALLHMQDSSWHPARSDHAVRLVSPANQRMEGRRGGCAIGIDIADQVRQGGEFEAFDQGPALADRIRNVQSGDGGIIGSYALDDVEGMVAAAVEDHNELEIPMIILLEIAGVVAQHRFDAALLVISRDEEQQGRLSHAKLITEPG